jgi:hypothetical protein
VRHLQALALAAASILGPVALPFMFDGPVQEK